MSLSPMMPLNLREEKDRKCYDFSHGSLLTVFHLPRCFIKPHRLPHQCVTFVAPNSSYVFFGLSDDVSVVEFDRTPAAIGYSA